MRTPPRPSGLRNKKLNISSHLPFDALLHCLVLTSPKVSFLDPQRADIFENTTFSKGSSLVVIEAHEGKGHWQNMDDFGQLMQQCSDVDAAKVLAEDPNIQPDDNATIIFTSGTTGLPSTSCCNKVTWTVS